MPQEVSILIEEKGSFSLTNFFSVVKTIIVEKQGMTSGKSLVYIKDKEGRIMQITGYLLKMAGKAVEGAERQNAEDAEKFMHFEDEEGKLVLDFSEVDRINDIKTLEIRGMETNKVSDGYHTFGELYEHRITNYITLARIIARNTHLQHRYPVWRSRLHSDMSSFEGWFLLGICKEKGQQITYHLPMSKWEDCFFAEDLEKAPEFDGHTAEIVLQRLKHLS